MAKNDSFHKVSKQSIRKAANRIAQAVRPKKLFSLAPSYAYGDPTTDSDVDFLLVIRERTRQGRRKASLMASYALDPRPFPVDIIVHSSCDIQPRIRGGDFFLEETVKRGQVLFKQ